MIKFIVIDQTLRDLLGHHYEYSVSTAEAARRMGFDAIILGNKSFDPNIVYSNVRIVAHFSEGWTGSSISTGDGVKDKRSAETLESKFLELGSFPLFVISRRFPSLIAFARPVYRWLKAVVRRVVNWNPYTKKIYGVLGAAVNIARSKVKGIRQRIKAQRELWKLSAGSSNLGAFGSDLVRGVKRCGAKGTDHVFVHTLSPDNFLDIVKVLRRDKSRILPHFHVLFRRDLEEPFMRRDRSVDFPQLLKRCVAYNLWPERLTLYTDTEALTTQHNTLSQASFKTAPIPFRHELISSGPEKRGPPVNVVYLGDAREEKGFQYLPDAVEELYERYGATGKVCFTLQCYVQEMNRHDMLPQVSRLSGYSEDYVRLIHSLLAPEEYYEVLAKADVVVIPYVAAMYLRRSSGVLTEALAAGKPVVVPGGTWMADQIDPTRGAWFDSPVHLADALASVVDRIEETKRAAGAFAEQWRQRHSPDRLADCILGNVRMSSGVASAEEQNPRGRVLFVAPGDYLSQNGGVARVIRAQLEYLVRRGFETHALLTASGDLGRVIFDQRRESREISAKADLPPQVSIYVASYQPSFLRLCRTFGHYRAARTMWPTLQGEIAARSAAPISERIRRMIKAYQFDVCLVNYVFNVPIAQTICQQEVPIACFTIDAMSDLMTALHDRGTKSDDVAVETFWLRQVDIIVSNNSVESEGFRNLIPSSEVKDLTFHVPGHLAAGYALAGCLELRDVLHASGPEAKPEHGDFEGQSRDNRPESLDLLYVSSNHPPNVRSLEWFYEEVFIRYLAPQGIRLVVAGDVARACGFIQPNTGVFLLGKVRDLDPLYEAAKIVIAPIVAGTGTSIKTVEAFAYGKPVVATALGMRGIRAAATVFAVFDDPSAFANRVLSLLADAKLRLDLARAGYRIYQTGHSSGAYWSSMDGLMSELTGEHMAAASAELPEISPIPTHLVEWNPEISALNQCLLKYLRKQLPSSALRAAALRALNSGFISDDWLTRATEILVIREGLELDRTIVASLADLNALSNVLLFNRDPAQHENSSG